MYTQPQLAPQVQGDGHAAALATDAGMRYDAREICGRTGCHHGAAFTLAPIMISRASHWNATKRYQERRVAGKTTMESE